LFKTRLQCVAITRASSINGDFVMTACASTLLAIAIAATTALATPAFAQAPSVNAMPWVLTPDMGYGYDAAGKTFAYRMGTSNAKILLKGAKKVPKNTLFFIGENGQLYMRSGPFLEDDGRFKFGPG
jgi:hypothetical protein